MSYKKQHNPVPSTPRAGGSLLRHDSAFSARNSHVTWPWSIGLGKHIFPADGYFAGVSCAGFRKTSAGGRPRFCNISLHSPASPNLVLHVPRGLVRCRTALSPRRCGLCGRSGSPAWATASATTNLSSWRPSPVQRTKGSASTCGPFRRGAPT